MSTWILRMESSGDREALKSQPEAAGKGRAGQRGRDEQPWWKREVRTSVTDWASYSLTCFLPILPPTPMKCNFSGDWRRACMKVPWLIFPYMCQNQSSKWELDFMTGCTDFKRWCYCSVQFGDYSLGSAKSHYLLLCVYLIFWNR